METIKKEEEIGQEESELKEWNEEDNKIENIYNLYYELSKFSGQGILREGWCHDLAK